MKCRHSAPHRHLIAALGHISDQAHRTRSANAVMILLWQCHYHRGIWQSHRLQLGPVVENLAEAIQAAYPK